MFCFVLFHVLDEVYVSRSSRLLINCSWVLYTIILVPSDIRLDIIIVVVLTIHSFSVYNSLCGDIEIYETVEVLFNLKQFGVVTSQITIIILFMGITGSAYNFYSY